MLNILFWTNPLQIYLSSQFKKKIGKEGNENPTKNCYYLLSIFQKGYQNLTKTKTQKFEKDITQTLA